MDTPDRSHSHLSSKLLAAYVAGTLTIEERAAAVDHLTTCDLCRDGALAIARGMRAERTRTALRIGVPATAAAALAVALMVMNPGAPPDPNEPIVRDAVPTQNRIGVQPPAPEIDSDRASFAWEDMGTDVRYRFNLTRSDGTEVWSGGTANANLTLPEDVTLAHGETYFWWVDALLLDGQSVTTGIQHLELGD